MILPWLRGADGLIDDPVQLLEYLCNVGRIASVL